MTSNGERRPDPKDMEDLRRKVNEGIATIDEIRTWRRWQRAMLHDDLASAVGRIKDLTDKLMGTL